MQEDSSYFQKLFGSFSPMLLLLFNAAFTYKHDTQDAFEMNPIVNNEAVLALVREDYLALHYFI
jgi:hypothetical protein